MSETQQLENMFALLVMLVKTKNFSYKSGFIDQFGKKALEMIDTLTQQIVDLIEIISHDNYRKKVGLEILLDNILNKDL